MGDKTITMEDRVRAVELVNGLSTKISEVMTQVQQMQKRVDDGQYNTAKGVSFLEVKHQSLLSYIVNLTHLMMSKVRGQSIKNDPTIDRLIEIRTVIEKMRPIDQKLKYQIDKLIKTAATGSLAPNDPLRFKPNPDNLVSKLEDGSGSEQDADDDKRTSTKIYKPPKVAAVHYDEDETEQDKKLKIEERKRKRLRNSSIMKDLKDQYNEGPDEIRDTADLHRSKDDKAGKEREEYEMKYFVRMPLTKKDLATQRKVRTMGSLNTITHFGDMGAFTGADGDDMDEKGPSKKKRKTNSSGKKKSKAAKKRFRRK